MGRQKRKFTDDAQNESSVTRKKKSGRRQGREEIKTMPMDPDTTPSATTENNSEDKSIAASDVPDFSASTRVFGIYELCEKILIFADLRGMKVFRARAITRTCHAVVFRSIPLKHEIFLHPNLTTPTGQPADRKIAYCELKRFKISKPDPTPTLSLVSRNPFVFGGTNARWCTGALSLSHGFESYVLSGDTNTTIEAMYLFNPPVGRIIIHLCEKALAEQLEDAGYVEEDCWFEGRHHLNMADELRCGHGPGTGIECGSGELKVQHLVQALRKFLAEVDEEGDQKWKIEGCLVQLLGNLEVVTDRSDG
ncbi:hypothetical protein TI39_contig4111g00006 [Zymoseptoria brevis]|uniref:Uncharacterized protein n=1 Tax=Zymoseptoria brevis TaxID=1047168 RepID=A0A0F4GGZ1_9PEZI|nr:hypothetical protein TI39_contig4111g00006 [Zymoseptoria brevis]